MKSVIKSLPVITLCAIGLISCAQTEQGMMNGNESETIAVIPEIYQTTRDTVNNVDTPAIWHGPNGEHWLLATAKETDVILVYDASTGERVGIFAEPGKGMGQLERPNSIAIVDDLAVIVERDNHRIQVFTLPEFESLGYFGEDILIKPYGMSILKNGDGSYRLFVTDNYETEDEQVPADSLLDSRAHEFSFSVEGDELKANHIQAFGDTSGPGILKTVESLMADPEHNRLLIADEDSTELNLKVYDLDGNFTGDIVGNGVFRYEPEGIALYSCENGSGYWVTTDQSETDNTFYVFDRESLELTTAFQNPQTTNTDGIVITQRSFPNFPKGGFFPIHNDGNVSAVSWATIAKELKLRTCMVE
ncbi:MAG: phytase [Bacteroidetes bacterium]|jgi:3-phytase|nr:phytase [Bacteroidota bacterium]